MSGARAITFKTNAKVNLFLRVVGRRNDGFHELESVFHSVALSDDMRVSLTGSGEIEVEMNGLEHRTAAWPETGQNLAYRAVRALEQRGLEHGGVRIEIAKGIPLAGGMAGGSANAAGVLIALNELCGFGASQDDLAQVGAEVGSDVPYCLSGGAALVMGRGETVTPLPAPAEMTFVLAMSNDALNTGDVYAAFDGSPEVEEGPRSAPMALALGAGDLADVAALLHNDLERGAFSLRPELAGMKQALIDAGCLGAGMTGSGPTMFGVVEGIEHGNQVAKAVSEEFDRVEVVTSAPTCVELT